MRGASGVGRTRGGRGACCNRSARSKTRQTRPRASATCAGAGGGWVSEAAVEADWGGSDHLSQAVHKFGGALAHAPRAIVVGRARLVVVQPVEARLVQRTGRRARYAVDERARRVEQRQHVSQNTALAAAGRAVDKERVHGLRLRTQCARQWCDEHAQGRLRAAPVAAFHTAERTRPRALATGRTGRSAGSQPPEAPRPDRSTTKRATAQWAAFASCRRRRRI